MSQRNDPKKTQVTCVLTTGTAQTHLLDAGTVQVVVRTPKWFAGAAQAAGTNIANVALGATAVATTAAAGTTNAVDAGEQITFYVEEMQSNRYISYITPQNATAAGVEIIEYTYV